MNQEILLKFIEKINAADVNGISELMCNDHTFIDSSGNSLHGKEFVIEGWKQYFNLFPDYKIEVSDLLNGSDTFLICGFASGTFQSRIEKNASFRIPATWKAIIENKKVKLWQVFADSKIQFDIAERFK